MTDQAATTTVESHPRRAHGKGLLTRTSSGQVLDVWYPQPKLGPAPQSLPAPTAVDQVTDNIRRVTIEPVMTEIDLDAAPADAADVYLRLHLLSHCLVVPNSINLTGIFGLLANVVWTSAGPCAVDTFDQVRAELRMKSGHVTVFGIDKFPRLVDYVTPVGVRIADGNRVRLGAHLAPGTTVMHEGFVNFNAGSLGESMIEGRVSQGVVIGAGTDIGGGASIMGTLSGGGKEILSIGERSLLGANSGLGIALGDDCVIEAGLYVMPGTKVTMPDGSVVKASTLNNRPNLLFIRNSQTGQVQVRERATGSVELNEALHSN